MEKSVSLSQNPHIGLTRRTQLPKYVILKKSLYRNMKTGRQSSYYLLVEAFKYMPKLKIAMAWNTEQFSRKGKLDEFLKACQTVISVMAEGVKLEIWDYSEWNVVQLQEKLEQEDIDITAHQTFNTYSK